MSWGSGTSDKHEKKTASKAKKEAKRCKCNPARGKYCSPAHSRAAARGMTSSHDIDHGIRWDGKRF